MNRKYLEKILSIIFFNYFIVNLPKRRKSKINEAPEIEISFITGQRGNPKIVIDGYTFVRNKGNSNHIYWRCSRKRSLKCSAKAVTNLDMKKCLLTQNVHNHSPEIKK